MNFNNEFDLAKKTALEVGEFLKSQTVKKIISQDGKDIKLETQRFGKHLRSTVSKIRMTRLSCMT